MINSVMSTSAKQGTLLVAQIAAHFGINASEAVVDFLLEELNQNRGQINELRSNYLFLIGRLGLNRKTPS